jgi:hypothetical protein
MPRNLLNNKTKGATVYNKILKEFTKINNKLPLERKVSLADRRKYIKEKIYPQFKGMPVSRVGVRAIRSNVEKVLDTIVPQEGCNINYISPSVTANTNWYDLDDFIRDVLPKCIFIRIDAGTYGQTKIFNTLNYDYTRTGVKAIVDNIREYVNNQSSVDVSFTGIKKLRRGKTNDGTPENYYIDFVLVVNSVPIDSLTPIIYDVPREERRAVTSVKNAILARVKDLSNKKKRKKNARKTAIKNINKLKTINKKQKRSIKPETKQKFSQEKEKLYKSMQKQLNSSFNKGLFTQDQYEKFSAELLKKILDNRRAGGII